MLTSCYSTLILPLAIASKFSASLRMSLRATFGGSAGNEWVKSREGAPSLLFGDLLLRLPPLRPLKVEGHLGQTLWFYVSPEQFGTDIARLRI